MLLWFVIGGIFFSWLLNKFRWIAYRFRQQDQKINYIEYVQKNQIKKDKAQNGSYNNA